MNKNDRYEYEKYMQMAQMQNNSLAGLQHAAMSQLGTYSNNRNPLQGCDMNAFSTKELEDMIMHLNQVYDRKTLHTPLQGPTRQQLKDNEALNNAWAEFMTVWKLVGKE